MFIVQGSFFKKYDSFKLKKRCAVFGSFIIYYYLVELVVNVVWFNNANESIMPIYMPIYESIMPISFLDFFYIKILKKGDIFVDKLF